MRPGYLRIVLAVALAFAGVRPASAQGADGEGILASALRMASGESGQEAIVRRGRSAAKVTTMIVLVGAGIGMALAADPHYVPSRFVPGNAPGRVDLSVYLGSGDYPGHSYRLTHRRGDDYGTRHVCSAFECGFTDYQLEQQYIFGYKDGYDDGHYEGRVNGHRQGWMDGRASAIEILDANGFVVYDGAFTPESYVVQEEFSDRKGMRLGGIALTAAGALIGLLWPDSPARSLSINTIPDNGNLSIDARYSVGF